MRSPSNSSLPTDAAIFETDALLRVAGLTRSLPGKNRKKSRQPRSKPSVKEELSRPAPDPRIAGNGAQWLTARGWDKINWLWHGFSTRRGGLSRGYCAEDAQGELNLGFTPVDDREIVARNRRLLVEAVTGDAATLLVTLRQIHSSVLVHAAFGDSPVKGDGLMTDEPGLLLGIQTADCIPVLVFDRKKRAVAAFHAGWRGTAKRIVESGVGRMRLEFGSRPEDLVAAVGPGIGVCCYAVGDEVLSTFESQFSYSGELFREVYDTDPVRTKYPMLFLTQRAPGHSPMGPSLHVDLAEANRRQLLAAGLRPRSIKIIGGCTSCDSGLFFSHRASNGHAGRMMSVIGIKRHVPDDN
jgi:polyphenol oxidase